MQKYQEGQTIILWMKNPEDEREHIQTKVEINKFYDGHIAVKVRGRMSSISYLEILQLTKKPGKRNQSTVDVNGLIARQKLKSKTYKYA
jgi:hypothetical protein